MDISISTEKKQKGVAVVCCYAHEDEGLMKKLRAHLSPLQHLGLITIWYDRNISPGAIWEEEIKQHLSEARIILLLISPDFMNSQYCYGVEMRQALKRHESGEATVIPVILRPTYWHIEPLERLQALPTDGEPVTSKAWNNQDEAFYNVAKGIRDAVEILEMKNPGLQVHSSDQSNEEGGKQGRRAEGSVPPARLTPQFWTNNRPVSSYQKSSLDGVIMPNHVPAWISWFLAAVGVSVTVYLVLTQHLLYAGVLDLLLVLIFIAREVWQKEFQRSFVSTTAGYIRLVIHSPLRWWYQKYYRNHLIEIYSSVERLVLLVLPPPNLEQIFIEPMVIKTIDRATPNPIALPKEPGSKHHSIWHYLASDNTMIFGGVGVGKSTLLRHMALTIVDRKTPLENKVSYKVPFILSLPGIGEELKRNEELSLPVAVEATIKKMWKRPPLEWVKRRLEKGRCLLLLDGLDEVVDLETRHKVVAWVQQQIYTNSNNRFVIASRPLNHYGNPLQNVISLEIQGFNRDQTKRFVEKWYQVAGGDSANVEELMTMMREKKYNILKLARSPLLLGMIIFVHHHRGTLPESRVKLYEEIFEIYLGIRWRGTSASRGELSTREKQKILQIIAYKMMEEELREIKSIHAKELIKMYFKNITITPEQFLESAEGAGILGKLGENYSFAHRSFQEYLAAVHIKDTHQSQHLLRYLSNSWWHETIIVYCAQADPMPIMEACLKGGHLAKSAVDLALDLYMEREVQKNVAQVPSKIRERFDQAMILATEDEKDLELQYKIANTLLIRRKEGLAPDDEIPVEEPVKDSSFITCVEYQLFLDQSGDHTRRPDHWQHDRFSGGQGLHPVLGVRPSDANAFCKWLSAQESGPWRYRLPTFEEAKDISVRQVNTGYWIDDSSNDGNTDRFVWSREELHPSYILNQDRVNDLSDQDNSFVLQTKLKPEEDKYETYITFARKLTDVYSGYEALIEHLKLISNLFHKHEQFLLDNCNRIDEQKKEWDNKIGQVKTQQADANRTLERINNLRARHTQANYKKIQLQKELDDAFLKAKIQQNKQTRLLAEINFQRRLARKYSIRPTSQSNAKKSAINRVVNQKLAIAYERKINIEDQKKRRKLLEGKIESTGIQASKLKKHLEGTDEEERNARQQLENANIQESKLEKQGRDIHKNLKEAERRLSSFRNLAIKFDAIYSDFSCLMLVHNPGALARNQILNLDYILVLGENENSIDELCEISNRSIQELTAYLDRFHHESNIVFADIKSALDQVLTRAHDLADQFNLISSKRYIQELDYLLSQWLRQLYRNRSWVRSKWRTRLYIRYFAKALAQYQSYADSFSTAQSVFRRYFDVYIAFTVLEERISGNLSASESILIVREPTGVGLPYPVEGSPTEW